MCKKLLYAIAVLTFGVVGTGCGGGSSTALPNAPAPPGNPKVATSAAKFVISIPAVALTASGRRPSYVSPSTASVGIVETDNGGTPLPAVTANVTPGSPNCSTTGGTTTCNITVPANPGSDSFAVSTYDGPGGSGNVLSSGTITATIAAGVANTTVPVVLGGVINSLTATLTDPYLPIGRVTTLNVSAKDAAGNTIIGTFDHPVTVAPVPGLNISQTALSNSHDASQVFIGYALGYPTAATSITATGDGHSASATLTPGSGIFYYYNESSNPTYDAGGFGTTVGPDGNVYYAELGAVVCATGAPCTAAKGGVGRLNPATGAFTDVQLSSGVIQVFFTSDGAMWATELAASKIAYFAPGAFPAFTEISIPPLVNSRGTFAAHPRAMAQDASGNLWFTDLNRSRVGKIPIAAPTTAPVFYSVPGGPPGTLGFGPILEGIAFGADGNLYALDHTNGVVDVINASTGTTTQQLITPEQTALGSQDSSQPRFIVKGSGSDNNLYFTQSGSVNAFTNGWLDRLATPSSFGNLALPSGASPDSLAAGNNVVFGAEFVYGGIDRADLTTGKVVTWPLIQNLVLGGPMPSGIAVNPADNSAWFACYGNQTAGGVVGGPISAPCVGHSVTTNVWSLWPSGTIRLSGVGSQAAQLMGIMEAGNSGPFTVSSNNAGVCAASAPSTQFDHNFLVTGVAAGTCTITVTDAHSRSVLFPVSVTQTTGTVQSVVRKTAGGLF